jgi:hypothetical protein
MTWYMMVNKIHLFTKGGIEQMLSKKLKKLVMCTSIMSIVIFSTSSIAFGITYKLGNEQKYKLVETYTIKHADDSQGDAYNVGANIDLGDEIVSPYIQDLTKFITSNGNITDNNGEFNLSLTNRNILKEGDTETVTVEETFDTGTLDYDIDKSKVTSDFSELPNYQYYLRSSGLVQTDDPTIQKKAKEITRNISNPYDKAYEIFKYVNLNTDYDYSGVYANKGALSALINHKGVCQDYSQLFVALCRASGIPARTVSGFRNINGDSAIIDLTGTNHMWSEFYLPGYGWVIAEPTATITYNNQKIVADNYFAKQLTPGEHIALQYDSCADKTQESCVHLSYGGYPSKTPDLIDNVDIKLYKIDDAALQEATNAVAKAEDSKLQSDVNSAKVLVEALSDSSEKTTLLTRLDAVQNIINNAKALQNATTAVENAENTKMQNDVNSARILVTALQDSTEKTGLLNRLDTLQNTINENNYAAQVIAATQSVTTAESDKTQTSINLARGLVSSLKDADKTSLNARLDQVQAYINEQTALQQQLATATKDVELAEQSRTQADIDTAKSVVNTLPNGSDKTSLLNRLDSVQKEIDTENAQKAQQLSAATQSVEKAESTQLQNDVNSASILVNALQNGTDKTLLLNRLNTVQSAINTANAYKAQLAVATQSVVKAENTKLINDVNSAQTLVNGLPNGSDKVGLQNRLDTVKKLIDQQQSEPKTPTTSLTAVQKFHLLYDACTALNKAKAQKTQALIDIAQEKIAALPDDMSQKSSYQAILNSVTAVDTNNSQASMYEAQLAIARQSVEKAESSQLQNDVNSASILVNALQNGTDKTLLLNRLNTVQSAINTANAYKTQLETATQAVIKAEDTRLQSDCDSSQILINALSNSADKESLQNRVDAVKKLIAERIGLKPQTSKLTALQKFHLLYDASTALKNAENEGTQTSINIAQEKINALPDDVFQKPIMQARLEILKAKINATQENIENAIKATIVIVDSTNRYPLIDKIRAILNNNSSISIDPQLMKYLQH